MMHAANFLHRDIAPDNIIVRADGTPVLLDFGAARRAVAEMSRSLTGIVKAGYSPHEQYAIRRPPAGAVVGPLRVRRHALPRRHRQGARGSRRCASTRTTWPRRRGRARAGTGRDFLAAIDACLKVRHSERPRSVAQLRPMLLGRKSQPPAERLTGPTNKVPQAGLPAAPQELPRRPAKKRWPAIAAMVAILGGAYAGYEYQRWLTEEWAGAHVGRPAPRTPRPSARRPRQPSARPRSTPSGAKRTRRRRCPPAPDGGGAARKEQPEAAEADADARRRRRPKLTRSGSRPRRSPPQGATRRRNAGSPRSRTSAAPRRPRPRESAGRTADRGPRRGQPQRGRRKEDERLSSLPSPTTPNAPSSCARCRRSSSGIAATRALSTAERRHPGGLKRFVDNASTKGASVKAHRARQGYRRRLRIVAQGC